MFGVLSEEKYYTIESLSTKRMVQEIGPVYIIYPCPEFIESQ